MRYESIADIYDANTQAAASLRETIASIPADKLELAPEGEKWSIANIAEHLAMVDEGMFRICRKLLTKAEEAGAAATGVSVSDDFLQKRREFEGLKVQAPEMVEPSGTAALAESLEKLDEIQRRFAELRPRFEAFDGNSARFPHPFFGQLSAIEWLVLMGEHTRRHTRQIDRLAPTL